MGPPGSRPVTTPLQIPAPAEITSSIRNIVPEHSVDSMRIDQSPVTPSQQTLSAAESPFGDGDELRPRKRQRNRASIAPRLCKACGRTYRYKRPHLMRYHYDEVMRGERIGSDDGDVDDGKEHEFDDEEDMEDEAEAERSRRVLGPGQGVFRAVGQQQSKIARRPTTSTGPSKFCNRCGILVMEDFSEHLKRVHGIECEDTVTSGFKAVNQPSTPHTGIYDVRPPSASGSPSIFAPLLARTSQHLRASSEAESTGSGEEGYEKLLRTIRSTPELSEEQRQQLIYNLFAEQIKFLARTESPIPRSQPQDYAEIPQTPRATVSTERDDETSPSSAREASEQAPPPHLPALQRTIEIPARSIDLPEQSEHVVTTMA